MKIAIIGTGNVGLAFANLLQRQGHQVNLGSRDPALFKLKLQKALPQFSFEFVLCHTEEALKGADLTLLAVPDDSIQEVCNSIASQLQPSSVIAHLSGALDSSILSSAQVRGLYCCSVHPLNSFPDIKSSIKLSQSKHGSYLYCEGQAAALTLTNKLFKLCGFVPINIEAAAKPLYHAASVFACNYLSVLMSASTQAAMAAGLDEKIMWAALQPLIQTTLHNIGENGPAESLSGPIARGDLKTIKKHRDALYDVAPELADLYTHLGRHAVDLVKKRDPHNHASIDTLLEELNND